MNFSANPKETYINNVSKSMTSTPATGSGGGLVSSLSALQKRFLPIGPGKTTPPTVYSPTKTLTNPLVFSSNQSATSPARQQYESSLTSTPETRYYDTATGKLTEAGTAAGKSDVNATPTPSPEPTPVSNTTTNTPDNRSAYLKYLTGMFDPTKVDTAQKNYEESQKRLAGIQSEVTAKEVAARRDFDSTLDRIGGTVGGAQEAARLSDRRSNQELADLAVREKAALASVGVYQNIYKMLLDAGATVEEADVTAKKAQQDALKDQSFSLSEGQERYTFNPTTGQYEKIAGSPKSSTTDGNELLSVTEAKALGVPYGTTKAEAFGKGGTSGQSETSGRVISLVDQLLGMNTDAITGVPSLTALIPGTDAQLTKNTYEQLKGLLSLSNREMLKGSGAISDFEFKVLERAATKLGTNLSNAGFKQVLQEMKAELSAGSGQGASGTFAEQW